MRPEASGSPDVSTAGSSAASGATGVAISPPPPLQMPPAVGKVQPPLQAPEHLAPQQLQPRSGTTAATAAASAASAASAQRLPADSAASPTNPTPSSGSSGARLAGLWVYPIKSAAPVAAQSWPLGPNGLALDREWALVTPNGGALRQGRHPRLATIQPRIDFDAGEPPHTAPCVQMSLVPLFAEGG